MSAEMSSFDDSVDGAPVSVSGDQLRLDLECPVCMEVPPAGKQIFQCSNGHILCSGCYDGLRTCPICRVVLPVPGNRSATGPFLELS